MKSKIVLPSGEFLVNLAKPMDISLRMSADETNANAWYLGPPEITPVREGDWIGKVSEGANINFNTIRFSPHAHGTHTESYGHISKEFYGVSDCFDRFFFSAKLITLSPGPKGDDRILTEAMIRGRLGKNEAEALIIRTLPNDHSKKTRQYDHSNWPYLSPDAAQYIRESGIDHLLIDLPSVDREDGDVKAHRAFWDYPIHPRKKATITELVFVPDTIGDSLYLLNLQVAHFKNDAVPSRPVLYEIG